MYANCNLKKKNISSALNWVNVTSFTTPSPLLLTIGVEALTDN